MHQKHLTQSGHSTLSVVDIFHTLRVFTKEPIREQEIKLECMDYKHCTNICSTHYTPFDNGGLGSQTGRGKNIKAALLPFSFIFVSNRPWAAQHQAAHVAIAKAPQRPVRLCLLTYFP